MLPEGLSRYSLQTLLILGKQRKALHPFSRSSFLIWNQVFEDLAKRNSIKHGAHHLLLMQCAISTQLAPLTLPAERNGNAKRILRTHGSPHNARAAWLLPAGSSHLSQPMSRLCVIACSLLIQPVSLVAAWPVLPSRPHPGASYPPADCPGKNWMWHIKEQPAEASH